MDPSRFIGFVYVNSVVLRKRCLTCCELSYIILYVVLYGEEHGMAGHLYPKTINGITYYYYQRTWREKIDPHAWGKQRGSGKSRVRTESIYLGTAESILQRLKETSGPIDV